MGSWNKWRGPALRGAAAVYAAKARWLLLDGEHGVIACFISKPALILFPFTECAATHPREMALGAGTPGTRLNALIRSPPHRIYWPELACRHCDRTSLKCADFSRLCVIQISRRGGTTMSTFRVLVFGSCGTGKTSLCNAITGENRPVGDSVDGTTFRSYTFKPARFGDHQIILTDTMGLNESNRGTKPSVKALQELDRLLRGSADGFNLLIHVMRKGRIDSAHEENYELFVRQIAKRQIPTLLAVTHCEDVEPMSLWATQNAEKIKRRGLEYEGIVPASFGGGGRFADVFRELREESRQALGDAICKFAAADSIVLYEGPAGFRELISSVWLWLLNHVFVYVTKGIPHADAIQLAKVALSDAELS
jgi:hypothetical protein